MKSIAYRIFTILTAIISLNSVLHANQAGGTPPTLAELRKATYTGLEDGPVSLLNGKWEGKPFVDGGASCPTAGLVDNVYHTGDLDGDGIQEAVVILWQSGGGTGEYTYVMVMTRRNGEIKNIGSALIGDRVKLRNGRVADGKIILGVLQAGENDPMCCPTMLATRTWSLQGEELVEGKTKVAAEKTN